MILLDSLRLYSYIIYFTLPKLTYPEWYKPFLKAYLSFKYQCILNCYLPHIFGQYSKFVLYILISILVYILTVYQHRSKDDYLGRYLVTYSFDSKLYDELCDPAELCKPFVDVVPSYPIPAFRPNYNCFIDHEHDNILSPILPSNENLFDFSVSVDVTYLDKTSSRRQRTCFSKYHNFLSLYNHSDFVKMHMHNAWLLGKTDLTISLPSDFFIQPKYLFVFCGTLKLSQICDNSDANTFDYHSFLFVASYLMINVSFLFQLLKSSGTIHFV